MRCIDWLFRLALNSERQATSLPSIDNPHGETA